MNDCDAGFDGVLSLPAGCRSRLGLLLARVGGALLDVADERLTEAGVDGRGYAALAVLTADEPRSQLELAQMMGKAPAIVVTMVDELEAAGLVERVRDPQDRRRTRVMVTAKGRAALARADELADELLAELLVGLDESGRGRLHALLDGALAPAAPARVSA